MRSRTRGRSASSTASSPTWLRRPPSFRAARMSDAESRPSAAMSALQASADAASAGCQP